jgi:thiamine pyrophosphate-dependent acetolactate synthase large subunit-like protein
VDMSKVIGALGFHTERVSEPAEVIPALRSAATRLRTANHLSSHHLPRKLG